MEPKDIKLSYNGLYTRLRNIRAVKYLTLDEQKSLVKQIVSNWNYKDEEDSS